MQDSYQLTGTDLARIARYLLLTYQLTPARIVPMGPTPAGERDCEQTYGSHKLG